MMQPTIHESTVAGVLREVIASADDPFLVTSSPALLRACVTVLDDVARPAARVLAPQAVLRDIRDDFRVASAAADLIAGDRLSLRTDETVTNTLVITADAVVALERTADHVAGLPTTDEAFVASATDHYGGRWAAAEDFALRPPPRSETREMLEDDIGSPLDSPPRHPE